MNSFVRHHHELIRFGYHGFDRIVCLARIPLFLYPAAIVRFLRNRHQVVDVTHGFLRQISTDYHNWLGEQAKGAGIPIVEPPDDPQVRRHDWVQPYFQQLGKRDGVAVILKCREPARVAVSFPSKNHWVELAWRHVNVYHFYLRDPQCGQLFVRICPYFPFNVQMCLNGHEWLAQQLRHEGIAFRKDDNAILDCANPRRLQELADAFGPEAITPVLDRALEQWLPYFSAQDRQRGYRHQLYVAQVEYCDNLIFQERAALNRLFERLLDLNRSIGRPDKLAIVFGRPVFHPDTRTGQTEVKITRLRTPVLRSSYKNTSLKQYVKNNVLLRTEAASHQLRDLSLRKSIRHLGKVRQVLHTSNERYLEVQQDVLASFVDRGQLQRLRQPTVSPTGRRVPGLRLDDVRLLALWQALTCFVHLTGHGTFRSKDLLGEVQRVLNNSDYKLSQLRYDLSKLRGKGLVQRLPNSQQYRLTPEAYRLAVIYLKLYHRLYAPLSAAILEPVAADNLMLTQRQAILDRLYHAIDDKLRRLTDYLRIAA